jgi:hypothetical protein
MLTNESLRACVQAYCHPNTQTLEMRAWLDANPIEGWDVSQVTDMSCLFFNKRLFNADLSRWNVEA